MNTTNRSTFSFVVEDDLISESSANTTFVRPRPFQPKPFSKDFGLKGADGLNRYEELPVPTLQKRIQEEAQNDAYRELNNDMFNPFEHKLQHGFAHKEVSLYEREKQKQIELIKKKEAEALNSAKSYTIVFNNAPSTSGRSLKVAANNILNEENVPAISDYYQQKFKKKPLEEISEENEEAVKKNNFLDKTVKKKEKTAETKDSSQKQIPKRLPSAQKEKIIKSSQGWKREGMDAEAENLRRDDPPKPNYSPLGIPKPPAKKEIPKSKDSSKPPIKSESTSVKQPNMRSDQKAKKVSSTSAKPGEKKKFSEVYEGPDRNLVEQLEKQISECPSITFDDIAELESAKNLLQEAVVLPRMMPEFFKGIRKAMKGILLFGPPGTGKTLLAKAVASNNMFFNVSASSLASKWKGESEKMLLFQMARYHSPSVIFFDQIDSIATKRSENEHESTRKVKTQLLVQMDGVGNSDQSVFVLAATNRPWDLDEALRRRLQKRICILLHDIDIPLPGKQARRKMFDINLKELKISQSVNWQQLVQLTKGCSGADICNICRDAAYMPMRRKITQVGGIQKLADISQTDLLNEVITETDLAQAAKKIRPSVGTDDLKRYAEWMKEFGSS